MMMSNLIEVHRAVQLVTKVKGQSENKKERQSCADSMVDKLEN